MAVSLKPLNEQVVVITGASSGIGLATALEMARRGARVVLTSRNERALAAVEQQILADGGDAIYVVADVSQPGEIERIAHAAIEHYGGFDTWINDAAVSIYGRLEEVSEEDSRQLFDVNFWGLVNGSLVAAEHLRHRGGAIINLGSMASDVAYPLLGMYSASKHAVKGFTDALRIELEESGAPISVTLIKPSAINTPFAQHARNYLEREPKLPSPLYPPEEVANAICHAAVTPKRDIYVGGTARVFSTLNRVAPRAVDLYNERMMFDQQKSDEAPYDREGILYDASDDEAEINGDPHESFVLNSSVYTRATLHPLVTAAFVGAIGMGLGAMLFRNGRD